MQLDNISDIIFDLGNVIFDIDFSLTESKLERFTGIPIDVLKRDMARQFTDFETGKISYVLFFNHLIKSAKRETNGNELIHAWNAMLLEIQPETWILLEALKKNHRLYILSNINDTHLQWFNDYITRNQQYTQWYQLFNHCYYSHEIGLRKPDPLVFDHLIQQQSLVPQATLFVDDSPENIKAAHELGFQTILFDRRVSTLEAALKDRFTS